MSFLKDLQQAVHGDGPLAPAVLRRRGLAAVARGLGVVGLALAQVGLRILHALAKAGLRILDGLKMVGLGLLWAIKAAFYMVWGPMGVTVAVCAYNYTMLTFLLRGFPAGIHDYQFYSPAYGWPMLIFEILVILYAMGKSRT